MRTIIMAMLAIVTTACGEQGVAPRSVGERGGKEKSEEKNVVTDAEGVERNGLDRANGVAGVTLVTSNFKFQDVTLPVRPGSGYFRFGNAGLPAGSSSGNAYSIDNDFVKTAEANCTSGGGYLASGGEFGDYLRSTRNGPFFNVTGNKFVVVKDEGTVVIKSAVRFVGNGSDFRYATFLRPLNEAATSVTGPFRCDISYPQDADCFGTRLQAEVFTATIACVGGSGTTDPATNPPAAADVIMLQQRSISNPAGPNRGILNIYSNIGNNGVIKVLGSVNSNPQVQACAPKQLVQCFIPAATLTYVAVEQCTRNPGDVVAHLTGTYACTNKVSEAQKPIQVYLDATFSTILTDDPAKVAAQGYYWPAPDALIGWSADGL